MPCKAVLLLVLVGTSPALAADLPEPMLPQGVGVNIHFTRGHEKDLDLIAAAGFKVVRMDFTWSAIERKKGEYDWSAYDELTANLEKHGLRPMYIFDYSNRLYEDEVISPNPVFGKLQRDVASPQHPGSVDAFARWAATAANRYRGRRVLWEIWNEPNIGFWKPRPDVRQYAELVRATCKAVRQADPHATIVAPASSGIPLDFLEKLFAAGVLADLDAVSVHPYRAYHRPPETAAEDYLKLRQLIDRYAPPGKKRTPILSGEWGYASHTRGVSKETQAAYLARQQLANLLNGVPLSIWYDWKDDGLDPNEHEHNFGTVGHDLSPKPAYRAAQTLTRELAGYHILRRLDACSEEDFALLLGNAAGHRKLAAWTLAAPHPVTLDASLESTTKVTGITASGKSLRPKLAGKRLVLDLIAEPQYVTLN